MDDQGFLLRRLPCGMLAAACAHAYCFQCVLTWSKRTNTCPMCKERFTAIRHNKNGGSGGSSSLRPGGIEIVEVSAAVQLFPYGGGPEQGLSLLRALLTPPSIPGMSRTGCIYV